MITIQDYTIVCHLVQIDQLSTVQCLESFRQPIQSDLNGDGIEKTETLVNTNVDRSQAITFKFTKPQKALTAGSRHDQMAI